MSTSTLITLLAVGLVALLIAGAAWVIWRRRRGWPSRLPSTPLALFQSVRRWKKLPPSLLDKLARRLPNALGASIFMERCEESGALSAALDEWKRVRTVANELALATEKWASESSSVSSAKVADSYDKGLMSLMAGALSRFGFGQLDGDARRALGCFRYAKMLDPQNKMSWIGRAEAEEKTGDFKVAVKWADKFLAYEPDDEESNIAAGIDEAFHARYTDALAEFRERAKQVRTRCETELSFGKVPQRIRTAAWHVFSSGPMLLNTLESDLPKAPSDKSAISFSTECTHYILHMFGRSLAASPAAVQLPIRDQLLAAVIAEQWRALSHSGYDVDYEKLSEQIGAHFNEREIEFAAIRGENWYMSVSDAFARNACDSLGLSSDERAAVEPMLPMLAMEMFKGVIKCLPFPKNMKRPRSAAGEE